MTDTLTGGCLCGAVRYSITTSQTLHYLCHCSDCRKHGGTPFHCGIVVPADELSVDGEPKVYTKPADSGRTIARYFCGDCGGHLMTSPWPDPTRYSIKAGTLDKPELYKPVAEIWRQSFVEWADRHADLEPFEQAFLRPVTIGQTKIEM